MEPGVGSTACRSHAVDVNGTADEQHRRVLAEGGHAAGLYTVSVWGHGLEGALLRMREFARQS